MPAHRPAAGRSRAALAQMAAQLAADPGDHAEMAEVLGLNSVERKLLTGPSRSGPLKVTSTLLSDQLHEPRIERWAVAETRGA